MAIKQVECGLGHVKRAAEQAKVFEGADFRALPVPGREGAVVLQGKSPAGNLFLSLLVAGAY